MTILVIAGALWASGQGMSGCGSWQAGWLEVLAWVSADVDGSCCR